MAGGTHRVGREEKRGEGGYQNDVGAWFIARPSDQLSRVAWNVRVFFFFFAEPHGMWDLSSPTRDEPECPGVEVRGPNH